MFTTALKQHMACMQTLEKHAGKIERAGEQLAQTIQVEHLLRNNQSPHEKRKLNTDNRDNR